MRADSGMEAGMKHAAVSGTEDGMKRLRIALLYWVIALVFFTPGAVYAYIDPATTTYIIQIMTALVVTIGVSLSVFLYRFRMVSAKIRYGLYGLLYRLRRGGGIPSSAGLLRSARNDETKGDETKGDVPCVLPEAEGPSALPSSAGLLRSARNDEGGDVAPGGGLPSSAGLLRYARNDEGGDFAQTEYTLPGYAIPGAAHPPTDEEMARLGEPAGLEKIPQKAAPVDPGKRNFAGRAKAVIPASLALSLSFILISCTESIVQNPADITFALSKVMPVLVLATVVCFVFLSVIVPLFRGRAFMILASLVVAVLIGGYMQSLFFNRNLGELTGDAIEWGLYKGSMAGNALFWAAVFVLVFLLLSFVKATHPVILVFIPILIVFIQIVGLASAMAGNTQGERGSITGYWEESRERLTFQGFLDLASEKNTIIIILDRFDQNLYDMVAAENPGFFDGLDGFTMFDDNLSLAAKTFPAATEMLTLYRFRWDRSDSDYFASAWENRNFLDELAGRGVDVRLYTVFGYTYDKAEQLKGVASNMAEVEEVVNSRIALVKLLKLSAFRHAPMPAKPLFWLSSDEFNHAIEYTGDTMPYLNNDFAFYDSLVNRRLSVAGDREAFTLYHLNGPHPPLVMDENVQVVENSSYEQQTIGSMKIVYEYLGQLKELGLYEQSTIIIMADHGIPEDNELTQPVHAAFFIKPSGSAGTPLSVNHAPVSHEQLPGTVLESFFGDTLGFPPGYFDIPEDADVVREYNHKRYKYEVTGDGRDFANWRYLGEYSGQWEDSKAR